MNKFVKTLDCESFGSTILSLEKITNIEKEEIINFLSDFDMCEFYELNPYYDDTGDVLLFDQFNSTFIPSLNYDKTIWFHLTRTSPSNDFKNGILPLGVVINDIWDSLYELASDFISREGWYKFRETLEVGNGGWLAHLYQMKTSNKFHHGPYAMLIRDTAFKPGEIGNHDYLDVPEIVEDICVSFEKLCGYDLLDQYRKATRPCIVKFVSNFGDPNNISPVLYYLYKKIHRKRLNLYCNTTYDAKGPILPENILNVEFL